MDDLGRLLLFRDVVDAGGFSHAANRRGLSHSTVSKHVRSLEDALGVLLLNRTSRTMSLTEAGRVVLGHTRELGASVEALHAQLDELRGDVVGELRINSLVHLGSHIVQPAVERYRAEFPRARVQLVLDDGPLHFNRDGFDIAVRVGRNVEGSLTATKLMDNAVCIVATPSFLERAGPLQHPRDLGRVSTVAYRSRQFDITAWSYVEGGEYRSVDVTPVCTVNDGNALLDLCLRGVGACYVSRFAVQPHLDDRTLVQLFPEFELPSFEPVFLFRAPTDRPPRKVRAFTKHLRAVVQGELGVSASGR
ncbi:MAG: LysR family transcriptional regulator [Myxococcota bacterium]